MFFAILETFDRQHWNEVKRKFDYAFIKCTRGGVPFLISGTAAIMDHMRKNSTAEETYLQPKFCETEYWFAGESTLELIFNAANHGTPFNV